jgi:hypothetical protein
MARNDANVRRLLGKIEKTLSRIEKVMQKTTLPDVDFDQIQAELDPLMAQLIAYFEIIQAESITIGDDLMSRLRLAMEEVARVREGIAAQAPVVSAEMIKEGKLRVLGSWRRGPRIYAHELYTKYFKQYALTLMLEFSKRTYEELQGAIRNIKRWLKERGEYYQYRPMTVLKNFLNQKIAANIKKSFRSRSSLVGDLLVPTVMKWQNLNPVYARIAGRNRRQPGSAKLEAGLIARAPAFARVYDQQFKNSEAGNMRFFLQLAKRAGGGRRWFWKVYSFYFGSDGLMFGGKVRRKRLRGEGVTKKGHRPMSYRHSPRGKGKWPRREQPARPFTLLTAKDIADLAAWTETHLSREFKREFAARASMRYIRTKTQVKIVRSREHGGWTTFALKEGVQD